MPLVDPVTMSSSKPRPRPRPQSPSKPSGPAAAAPELQPIPVRATTPLSRTLRHAQPAAVLAAFLYAFPALVADPVATLGLLLPLTTAAQLVWAVVCLPPAGTAKTKPPRAPPGDKKRRDAAAAAGPNPAVAATLSTALTLLAVPVLHAGLVLFGAPARTHAAHTLLAAAHLAALGVLPLLYARGVDGAAWRALGGGRAAVDDAYGGLVGAAVGAWLGAVPIPLDWDRDWQAWPVTVVAGMYAGWAVGRVVGGTVGYGRRFAA